MTDLQWTRTPEFISKVTTRAVELFRENDPDMKLNEVELAAFTAGIYAGMRAAIEVAEGGDK